MTKHCPNCGNERDDNEKICSACGFVFSDDEKNKADENNSSEDNKQEQSDGSSSHFSGNEENESIEWADLKDLSIGHVMDMFNEQQKTAEEENESVEPLTEEGETESTSTDSDEIIPPSESAEAPETVAEQEEQQVQESEAAEMDTPDETIVGEPVAEMEQDEADAEQENDSEATLKEYIEAHKKETAKTKSPESNPVNEPLEIEEESEVDTNQTIQKEDTVEQEKTEAPVIPETEESNEQLEETHSIPPVGNDTDGTEAKEEPLVIDSKSKKPEEIEMDAAPIFFKEKDVLPSELGPRKKTSQFANLDQAERPKTNSNQPPKQSTSERNKKRKKTPLILAAVAALALGGGGWYYVHSQNQAKEKEAAVTNAQKELLKKTKASINSYFLNDEQVFLKSEMVNVSTDSVEADLEKLKDEKEYQTLSESLDKVKEKQTVINKVNELYTSSVIAGDTFKEQPIVADKAVSLSKETGDDGFSKLINQAIDNAKGQYDQLQTAKAAVANIYKEDKATEALSQQTYATAETEVNKIKNSTLKEPLTATLKKAKAALDTQLAAITAEQNQAQESVAVEGSANNQAAAGSAGAVGSTGTAAAGAVDANGFSAPDSNGVYTAPVYPENPTDVADSSNPAWIWAPGIQEKVIATCIARGYMTADGYYLQPAQIVNGQGYYNLYKTDGTYLVTINAQTGWFKGNASRNAGR
ncbi:cell division site-positioning protein MapZ family protein [Enterococcus sp. LJL128]